MAYRLGIMADRVRFFAAAALAGLVSACAPTLGPPPPGMALNVPDESFRAGDFAWSQTAGHNAIMGRLAVQTGPVHYTCTGSTVVLTPETPWSRRRMIVLYKSDLRSALPTGRGSRSAPVFEAACGLSLIAALRPRRATTTACGTASAW